MFKRAAILCCVIAFAALQVHNVVPHHHTAFQYHVHHHDRDSPDGDEDSPLSGQTHDAEFGKSIVKPERFENVIENPAFLSGQFILLFDKLAAFEGPGPKVNPDHPSSLYTTILSRAIPLRAPPGVA
jgi:hypothetical protein